eukprot:scaffold55839_cov28-Prasinocladus_malaysianus.AAC.1
MFLYVYGFPDVQRAALLFFATTRSCGSAKANPTRLQDNSYKSQSRDSSVFSFRSFWVTIYRAADVLLRIQAPKLEHLSVFVSSHASGISVRLVSYDSYDL